LHRVFLHLLELRALIVREARNDIRRNVLAQLLLPLRVLALQHGQVALPLLQKQLNLRRHGE